MDEDPDEQLGKLINSGFFFEELKKIQLMLDDLFESNSEEMDVEKKEK